MVNTSVTLPAVVSAAEGKYIGFTIDESLNVPVPKVVQVEEVAPPPIVPDKV